MKFDRKELLKSLSLLKPAISSTSSIPQLRHIWFEGNKAFAYNGGLGIKVDLKTGFKFAVLGAPLLKLLGDDAVDTVTLEESNGVLTAKLGRATIELPTLELDTSPWPKYEGKAVAELSIGENLHRALKRACLIRAAKPLRVEHYGVVLFSESKGELLFYTTDNRILIEVQLNGLKRTAFELNKTVLPFEFVEAVQQLEEGTLSICKDCLRAEGSGMLVFSNLLDVSQVADLPGLVDEIMKDKAVNKMIALPDKLGSVLDRAKILSDGGDVNLTMVASNSTLVLEGKLPLGKFKESVPLDKTAATSSIPIDGKLLKKALGEGKRFAVVGERLVVEGDDNFLFIQAAYSP